MRSAFLIAFLHFVLFSFGQVKLNGMYDEEYGFRITFENDSIFKYIDGQAFEIQGRGIFKIDNNVLILRFINHDTLNGSIEIKESECETGSFLLKFHVIDKKTGDALIFARISISDRAGKVHEQLTDFEGNVVFKFKTQTKPDSPNKYDVECIGIGYEKFMVTISDDKCSDISIGLTYKKCTIENGVIWKYKILKVTNDKLVLKEIRPFSLYRTSMIYLHKR